MGKQKCGVCKQVFDTREEYLNHSCPGVDGAKPTEPEFLIRSTTPNYEKIAEKAIERGENLK